jgi:hypothetical protein
VLLLSCVSILTATTKYVPADPAAIQSGINGGGISCLDYSFPTIKGNIISENNTRYLYGGGIGCSYSTPTKTGNTIIL